MEDVCARHRRERRAVFKRHCVPVCSQLQSEDRGIGSVTRQSKHFLAHSEGDRERKKRGSVFVCVLFFFSVSFLISIIKTVKQPANSCQRKGDRELKLRDVLDAVKQR